MSTSRKEEARALDADERELVAKTHHPEIQDVEDGELKPLLRLVRERRDRARDEASRRRREMRGKAAPKGAAPSASAAGSKAKLEHLAMAVRRLNAEISRRERLAARVATAEGARRALELKQAAGNQGGGPVNSRHAHQGMVKAASGRRRNLVRPMELGRLRKAGAVAQARRDSR